MLLFNQMTDYAMVIVHFMSKNETGQLGSARMAALTGIPRPTVSILLKKLLKAGLCNAKRGAKGGYHLSRSIETISLWDVIAAIQGEVVISRCTSGGALCDKIGQCAVQSHWVVLNHLLQNLLKSIRFDQLQRPLGEHPLLQSMQQLIHDAQES